jgi:hypothetical protein
MEFVDLKTAIAFYEKYAKNSGFGIRLHNQRVTRDGVIAEKYVVCNKHGDSSPKGTVKKRQKTRIRCKANVCYKVMAGGKYKVHSFHEGHTHQLATPSTMVHLTQERELNPLHMKMIMDNSRVNKGPVLTFRMFKEYVRGYKNIGASLQDFKNFHRDLKKFIKHSDGEMIIETFMNKKRLCSSFYFDFEVDQKGRICKLFWADPVSIKNFLLFGDMTSFDTTFNKNLYKMIFCPFTGVDHHKKCVTFGAGLLAHEDEDSFTWLFDNFRKAMGGRYPKCIITDQDLGIKAGVKNSFGIHTHHRYCMWHIMKKVPDKVSGAIMRETDFLKELCCIVWGEDVEIAEFEGKWNSIMLSYDLSNNQWFNEIYGFREKWVPAYFRDLFLGGLMRTTSRSESENNFFNYFTNPNLTLVEFWMRFESALDAQRWKQANLIAMSKNTFPRLETPLPLEQHASKLYTPAIFDEFQTELKAACYFMSSQNIGKSSKITITDRGKNKDYIVDFKAGDKTVKCSCKKFERFGILCRHALYVLKEKGFDEVPSTYMLNRWSKLATCQPVMTDDGIIIDDCKTIQNDKNRLGELWSEVFSCVSIVEQDSNHMDELLELLQGFKEKVIESNVNTNIDVGGSGSGSGSGTGSGSVGKNKRKAVIQNFLGTTIPDEINILPPKHSKTKGSGRGGRRLRSAREKAVENNKAKRLCKSCGEMCNHDSRNCPGKI